MKYSQSINKALLNLSYSIYGDKAKIESLINRIRYSNDEVDYEYKLNIDLQFNMSAK